MPTGTRGTTLRRAHLRHHCALAAGRETLAHARRAARGDAPGCIEHYAAIGRRALCGRRLPERAKKRARNEVSSMPSAGLPFTAALLFGLLATAAGAGQISSGAKGGIAATSFCPALSAQLKIAQFDYPCVASQGARETIARAHRAAPARLCRARCLRAGIPPAQGRGRVAHRASGRRARMPLCRHAQRRDLQLRRACCARARAALRAAATCLRQCVEL